VTGAVDDSQRAAARVVGITYLLTNATAMFAAFYAGSLVVDGDAAKTAANITASERLFRLGIASDLFTFAAVVPLIVALYVVLRPVKSQSGPACAILAARRDLDFRCRHAQ